MRTILVCLAVALLSSAAAQTSNPVVEHYRAYRAAFDKGDLAMAETAAEAALAASEVQDGDGGRTAVLALNLANTRLQVGDGADALAPAQRAYGLSLAGAAGVEPLFAEFILARAELAAGAGGAHLRALLASPTLSQLPAAEIYPAAAQLGTSAFATRDFATAEMAWSAAGAYASGANGGAQFGAGTARTWQAAAIFFDEIGRGGGSRMDEQRAGEAYRFAGEAVRTLASLPNRSSSGTEVPVEVRALGEALAVRNIIKSKLLSDGQALPNDLEAQGDAYGFIEVSEGVTATQVCPFRIEPTRRLNFPGAALTRGYIGAVAFVARIHDDESVTVEVIAAIGDDSFADAVERALWRLRREEDAPSGCRLPTAVLHAVTFLLSS